MGLAGAKRGRHVDNTGVRRKHFVTHQNLVEATKKGSKALVAESINHIHVGNI
jgi:hypothetical protein